MAGQSIEQDNELFKSVQYENIALVHFKAVSMEWLSSLNEKGNLLSFFQHLSCHPSIKVVILLSPNHSCEENDFFALYKSWSESTNDRNAIYRTYNAINQIMLSIMESRNLFVSAQSGKMIFPLFSLSFACNSRIVADNYIVQNPEPKIGSIAKGAGAFFLPRILGPSKAIDILLSNKNIGAYELLRMKLVDRVVTFNKLKQTAFEIAHKFTGQPTSSLVTVKRLVNYSLKDLRPYLEYENKQLSRILVNHSASHRPMSHGATTIEQADGLAGHEYSRRSYPLGVGK